MDEMENESRQITSDCEDSGAVDIISHTLTTTPHVVKDILSKLAARDLNRCSRVCRLWAETVKIIKVWRKTRSWMFYTNDTITAENSIIGYIHGLYTEPSLFFMFCQKELLDSSGREKYGRIIICTQYAGPKGRLKAPVGEYIKNLLPSNCSFIGLSTDGVVGTSPELKTYELEYEKGISFMSLPKYNGVDVYTFTTDIHMFEHGNANVDIAQISTIPVDKDPKAILFFCDYWSCPPEIGNSLLRHYPDAVIAGGYVDNLVEPVGCFYDPAGEASPSLMCVAFCGDNVKVASVVISKDVNNDADVEKQIKQLKTCNFPEERSFAFMFTSVTRGFGLYGRNKFESSAFRKIFPKTPLLGFFGSGEVGFNHLPGSNSSEEPRIKKGRSPQKLYHAYATILCLVSVV